MAARNPKVDAYIAALSGDMKNICSDVRTIIFDVVPDVAEEFKWGQPCYGMDKTFCYIKAASKHVNLGFDKGAVLQDPEGLLEGTGKLMRHIKLKPGKAIPEAHIRLLVEQASQMASA